jgi:hypothetical protein
MAFFALAMPSLAAYAALRLLSVRFGREMGRGVAASIAPPLGLGISSLGYFALLHIARGAAAAVPIDASVWLIATAFLVVAWIRRERVAAHVPSAHPARAWTSDPATVGAATAFALLVAASALAFWSHSRLNPYGEWDGFAIWNLRARSIVRGAPEWSALFSPAIAWSHPDYPLLVPMTVARAWAYTGHESAAVPAAVAALFALCTAGFVVTSVASLRGPAAGFLAGIALLCARTFVFQSSCQCADVPFGLYLLAAVSSIAVARQSAHPAAWLLTAGAAAGLAAWTKDEGQLLLIVVGLASVTLPKRFSALAFVAAGAAAPLVAVGVFKLAHAPASYLTQSQTAASILGRLVEPSRWALVIRRTRSMLPAWGNIPGGAIVWVAAAVVGTAHPSKTSIQRIVIPAVIIASMLVGYVVVYVITPLSIEWQVATSFDRLLTQLWPGVVWTAFSGCGASAAGFERSREF